MVCFVRDAVGQISDCKLALSCQHLLRAADPERLQVTHVADVLLDGPRVVLSGDQYFMPEGVYAFLEASRASSQPFQDIRKKREGKIEGKLAFKPRLQGTHLLSFQA